MRSALCSLCVASALVATLIAVPAAGAARTLYTTNRSSHDVSAFTIGPGSSLTALGAPVGAGRFPQSVAVTPDGRFVFVANSSGGTISRYAASAGGALSPLGTTSAAQRPESLAVSPTGSRLYASTIAGVETFAIASDGGLTSLGMTGSAFFGGVAVAPDGQTLYVTAYLADRIDAYALGGDGRPTGAPTSTSSPRPFDVSLTPDGRFLYTGNNTTGTVSGFATGAGGALTPVPGSPFAGQPGPEGLAVSPIGGLVVPTFAGVSAVIPYRIGDDGGLAPVSGPVGAGGNPVDAAITPNGRSLFVFNILSNSISRFDIATNGVLATAGPDTQTGGSGGGENGIVVSPDQGPTASFTAPTVRGGTTATPFDGRGSSDPDGAVARYDWDFGDGATLPDGGPTPQHVYRDAGVYMATLTVTDDEGCSTARTFTGQVVSCNGGPPARVTLPVEVLGQPLPVRGLNLSGVSANRYCIGSGTGAGRDIKISYTLSEPAKVTFALQRRTTPAAEPRRTCPVRKPGGPGRIPVQFGELGSSQVDGAQGENFATVDGNGKVTKSAARTAGKKRKAIRRTITIKKRGRQRATLRGLFGSQALAPGWYRVLISARRADGSVSQSVAVKFWVLGADGRRR
jgi:6-phosphogluconolactonase (cycloisomerase 2 family)